MGNIRDYSSIYNIKDFIMNDVAPKYFDMEDISKLNTGLFGMVTDIGATVAHDTFTTTSRYITELIPGKAVLPEFIYAHAANYAITDIFAKCAHCKAALMIREDHIIKYGEKDGNYINYYIDSDLVVYIDDVPFSIPYDIRIRSRYYNGKYNHNCTYSTNKLNNSIVQMEYPYLKSFKTRVVGQDVQYLAISIDLYQYTRRKVTEPIISNNVLNIPYLDFTFTDKLCNFEVMYHSPDGSSSYQLIKKLDNEPGVNNPFCYYKMVDDGTFRISFTTNDVYFTPEYNSEIDVYIYETLGDKGNFPIYNGTNVFVSADSSDPQRAYNKEVPLFCNMTSDSIDGSNGFTLAQLALLTWEATLSINARNTDQDLDRYFNSYTALYDTKALFIKSRDDFATREYACYTRIRDDINVFPTNTLNVNVGFEHMGGWDKDKNRYILKPGARIVYDGNSDVTARVIDNSEPEHDIEYTSVTLMSIELEPNNVMVYMNSIDKTVPVQYWYINERSMFQFIMRSLTIRRNAVIGEDAYHIKVTIVPTDISVLESTIYLENGIDAQVDDYGNAIVDPEPDENTLEISKLSLYLYVQTADRHYIKLNYVESESSSDVGYVFEAYLKTNDVINSGTIEITNLTSTVTQVEETCSVSIDAPDIRILTFYEESTVMDHVYKDELPGMESSTLCNEFIPDVSEYYLAHPLTLIRSTMTFLPQNTEPGFYLQFSQLPLFSRKFLLENSDNIKNVLDQVYYQHGFLQKSMENITSNFTIQMKLFNTYGKSRIFSISNGEKLNRTYCSISFYVKSYNGVDDSYFNDMKHTIKTYIEGLNITDDSGESGINSISVSQLQTLLHQTYEDQLDALIFKSINGYGSDIQLITMNKDLSKAENIKMVPEFLTINTNDIELIPFVEPE